MENNLVLGKVNFSLKYMGKFYLSSIYLVYLPLSVYLSIYLWLASPKNENSLSRSLFILSYQAGCLLLTSLLLQLLPAVSPALGCDWI